MRKIYGATAAQNGLQQIGRHEWELFYGFGKDSDDAETGWNWRQRFTEKPTLAECKSLIFSLIDGLTDEKILSGCTYEGEQVWLSTENQFNYKADYDLAVQTDGANLPVTVKLGGVDKPVYKTFTTVEEFRKFYTEVLAYIKQCYTDGWKEKDSIDWTLYQL